MLTLYSDVIPADAPTGVRAVGSHLDVAAVLPTLGEDGAAVRRRWPTTAPGRQEALVTGGPVMPTLGHPFLVHAASWPHRGSAPRFPGQPAIEFLSPDGYDYDGPGAESSLAPRPGDRQERGVSDRTISTFSVWPPP